MINRTVLMSDAHHFRVDHAINPYYHDSAVDVATAQAEHDAIRLALETAGVTVLTTPSPEQSQDGVYTANWALVRGDTAVLARLPSVRRSEEAVAKKALESLGKRVITLPEGLKFSGQGDALACGDYLFCGRHYRSDEAAQTIAATELGYTRIQLQTVPQLDFLSNPITNPASGWPDSYFYDIDLALAVIRHPSSTSPGLIAYCPEAFTESSQETLRSLENIETIAVSLEEAQGAFATNLVSTGETVVMSDHAPLLSQELGKRGLSIVTPSITELSKGGGYIRCTTLSLD